MTDIIINQTRGGTISAPFVALSVETLTIQGANIEDGTTVALLGLDGGTLAITHTTGNAATLDLNTIQADAATRYETVGTTVDCVLAIGDTDALQALIPATLTRNVLDNVAPPTQMAPTYPTSAELEAFLKRINQSVKMAQDAAETAAEDVATKLQQELGKTLKDVEDAASVVDSAKLAVVDYVDNKLPAAAEQIKRDISEQVSTAQTEITNQATQATQAIAGQVTAANNAATAADGSAKAADKSRQDAEAAKTAAEIALNNGCVYEVRDVADAAIGLDKTLTAYKHTPTGDTSYTFNAPQGAEGKIIVFWLWVVIGETAHALTFPPSVAWLSEPSFGANTQTLLAFMSVDGGETWTANVQWEA